MIYTMNRNNYFSDLELNREQRRALAKAKQKLIAGYPEKLTLVSPNDLDLPYSSHPQDILEIWRSKKYLVIVWKVPAGKKLSISRQEWDSKERRYKDGITWDEIMEIKHDIGMGNKTGIEFFPADDEVINLGNVRHIWIVPDDKINDILKLK